MIKSLMLAAGMAALLAFAVPSQAFSTADAPTAIELCGCKCKDKKDKGDKDEAEQASGIQDVTALCDGNCKDKKDKDEDKDE